MPVGPDIQYTAEKPGAPITLFVFTGADGSFDYYEDDGVSYGYERGEFARIPLRYDVAKGTLTIGARSGSYPGMPAEPHVQGALDQGGRQSPGRPGCGSRYLRRVQRGGDNGRRIRMGSGPVS